MGLGTGSSSSLGIFRDRLPRERYRGSVGLGGFWGLAPRDRAFLRAQARSRCRWVAFGDRLLLLVRDRLPGELRELGTGCSRLQALVGD